ncbi:hypothetical protein [Nocardia sp. NPDC024068]|uniref:hypothetical protein n=1 Tax=Nocardia sp. NPDC024068 TaxID=3157197 RepID=UPI0033E80AD4
MGIFGFTWADGGAFVGGALGAAFFGPPGAMLGSAVGSFAGGALGDDKGAGAAFEEALVAGIGAAGGAWATNLGGKLLKDGIASAATKALPANAAQRADRVAAKALLPWNKHGGGPVAALGGAFGGYEVSVQARPLVRIATTDIGNGGCPAQMSNLRMPAGLTGSVGELYLGLPGYLCEVWRGFGAGVRKAPPAPTLPKEMDGVAASGIADYRRKARHLDTVMAGFAALDTRAVALIGRGTERISREGRLAVGSLIATVNTRAAQTPADGMSGQVHALDLLDEAFRRGREILSQAVTASDRVAADVDDLSAELNSLREEFDDYRAKHEREHPPGGGRPALPPAPAYPPPPAVPAPVPSVPAPMPVPPTSGTAPAPRSWTGESTTGTAPGIGPEHPGSDFASRAGTASGAADSWPVPGTGTTGSPPSPWVRPTGTDSTTPESAAPLVPEPEAAVSHVVPSADPAAPIGWSVPSYVPAGWSGGVAAAATPASGPTVAVAAGRTPWTDLAAMTARADSGGLWAPGQAPAGPRRSVSSGVPTASAGPAPELPPGERESETSPAGVPRDG